MAGTGPVLPGISRRARQQQKASAEHGIESEEWPRKGFSPTASTPGYPAVSVLPTLLRPGPRNAPKAGAAFLPLGKRGQHKVQSSPSAHACSDEQVDRRDRRCLHSKALIREHVDAEISHRYNIDPEELGSGGYGRVFLATDSVMKDREVAIKKVRIVGSDMRTTFEKEMEIMKDLDHPNICKVFESYDEGKTVFLVMEYCQGGALMERIIEQDSIAEKQTAEIICQVGCALKYAHGKGIAHRDLKPENICFCSKDPSNNHVKVIDWGVGFYFGMRRMRTVVGSFTYTAPEVLGGEDTYTSACDLWSLGVIMYIMLCGELPFLGRNHMQVGSSSPLRATASQSWDAVSASVGAKEVVEGLLQRDPSKRMAVETLLAHPWVRAEQVGADHAAAQLVLSNMRRFTNTSCFFSFCASAVARQLDHRRLDDMRRVFQEMDVDGDGVLSLPELRAGFDKIFGRGSVQVKEIDEMFFRILDLDGSGYVDYTEFCAAGLGEKMNTEVDAIFAAFNAFDVHEADGKLTKDEVVQVLIDADIGRIRSRDVVESMTEDIFGRFDRDGDGLLSFDEWFDLIRHGNPDGVQGKNEIPTAKRKLPLKQSTFSKETMVPSPSGGTPPTGISSFMDDTEDEETANGFQDLPVASDQQLGIKNTLFKASRWMHGNCFSALFGRLA